MTGHEHAQQIVSVLLEMQIQRVCAGCEEEFGPVPTLPGHQKSHGYCRRHMKQYFPGMDDEIDGMPEEGMLLDRAAAFSPPPAGPASSPDTLSAG